MTEKLLIAAKFLVTAASPGMVSLCFRPLDYVRVFLLAVFFATLQPIHGVVLCVYLLQLVIGELMVVLDRYRRVRVPEYL